MKQLTVPFGRARPADVGYVRQISRQAGAHVSMGQEAGGYHATVLRPHDQPYF